MSEVLDDLHYSAEHEWIKVLESGEVSVGITDHAQDSLSDIVYVELPELGSSYHKGEAMAIVESVKAASDIFAPLTGKVTKINETLEETPELLNESPYELGWIFNIKPKDLKAEMADMMDGAAYREFIAASQ